MSIHVWHMVPYDVGKNLGAAYNRHMELIPDGDSACFTDGDSMMLIPDWGHVIHHYANQYPDAVLTAWLNRIHPLSKGQNANMPNHTIEECLVAAKYYKSKGYSVDPITGSVSGTIMVIPKKIWKEHPFGETNKYRPGEPNLLGCDNEWTNRIRDAGVQILRMNSLLVFHQYRMLTGSKEHLL